MAFQTIISRNKKPVDAGVISVTMIHTGEATNVVPDSCEIQGTVRTFTYEVLDMIERRMQEVAEHTCCRVRCHGGVQVQAQLPRPPSTTPPRPRLHASRHGRHRGRGPCGGAGAHHGG